MKIIHCTWSMGIGGIERLVLDLCKQQRKCGLNSSLLVGQAIGGFSEKFREAGVPVFDGQLKNGFDLGWGKREAIETEFKTADIIHLHNFSPTIVKFAARSGRPIIYTDHGSYGYGRKHTWRDRLKKRMQAQFFKRNVNFVTFNSKFTNHKTKEIFSFENVPNKVIYNGINFNLPIDEWSDLDQLGLPDFFENAFIVGTSSRFAGVKRIDKLIHAFAAMRGKENSCLLLVGDGDFRYSYEALVESLGIKERTVFTGYKTNVAAYQAVMDVCVFPSFGETFGLAVVETLALGKPTIVTSDSGGMAELLMPLEPLDVVDDVAGITNRLDNYYENWQTTKVENIDKKEKRIVYARRFNIEHMSEEFSDVYRQCLNAARGN